MAMFEVATTCSGLPGVELRGASPAVCRLVRGVMMNNFMPSGDYRARQGSGAFLQCYDEENGYLLIEFWQSDYSRFVDHLNGLFGQ